MVTFEIYQHFSKKKLFSIQGPHCDQDIDECADPHRCVNGHCLNTNGSYLCECDVGYTDPLCSTLIPHCSWDTCQNGGTCINRQGGHLCVCHMGYTGANCETRLDDVDLYKCTLQCENGGICRNALTPKCECPPQYTGKRCEVEKPNPCAANECASGSLCVPNNDYHSYHCQCPSHMRGEKCDLPLQPCDYNPCMHGVCRLNSSHSSSTEVTSTLWLNASHVSSLTLLPTFHCKCFAGYEGRLCERATLSDHCQPNNPCLNDGHCRSEANGYQCSCRRGFTGRNCEAAAETTTNLPVTVPSSDIEPSCSGVQCLNDGTCVGGECRCLPEFKGRLCEIRVNGCDPSEFPPQLAQPSQF